MVEYFTTFLHPLALMLECPAVFPPKCAKLLLSMIKCFCIIWKKKITVILTNALVEKTYIYKLVSRCIKCRLPIHFQHFEDKHCLQRGTLDTSIPVGIAITEFKSSWLASILATMLYHCHFSELGMKISYLDVQILS